MSRAGVSKGAMDFANEKLAEFSAGDQILYRRPNGGPNDAAKKAEASRSRRLVALQLDQFARATALRSDDGAQFAVRTLIEFVPHPVSVAVFVAEIAQPVAVVILLIGIGLLGAIVLGIGEEIAVAVTAFEQGE